MVLQASLGLSLVEDGRVIIPKCKNNHTQIFFFFTATL